MIKILYGKLRSGKTLRAVEMAYEALCRGEHVATNIELYYEPLALLALKEKGVLIRRDQIQFLDLNEIPSWQDEIKWGVVDHPVLVLLDEIHLFFNARDYAKTDKIHRSLLAFLSQSGKACVDVVFIAQVITQVEKQFRSQAQIYLAVSRLGGLHIPLMGEIPFSQNIIKTIDADTGFVLRTERRDYPKKIFGCYNTLAFLDKSMQDSALEHERHQPFKLDKLKGSNKKKMVADLTEGLPPIHPAYRQPKSIKGKNFLHRFFFP